MNVMNPADVPDDIVAAARAAHPEASAEPVLRAVLAAALPLWPKRRAEQLAQQLTDQQIADCFICEGAGTPLADGGSNCDVARDRFGRLIIHPRQPCYACSGTGTVTRARFRSQMAEVQAPDWLRRHPFA